MEVPLVISHQQYSGQTVFAWQHIWKTICEMAYRGTNIQEEIVTTPGYFQVDEEVMMDAVEVDQTRFYEKRTAINDEQLTFDFMWKIYSHEEGLSAVAHVIPQFKRLHVPACLYYSLGVDVWVATCFPNCTVTFWER